MDRGNPAQVFENVLLADESHRKPTPCGEHRRDPEELLHEEDAFGMVPQGPVPEVGHVALGAVQKVMILQVLLRDAAELLGR